MEYVHRPLETEVRAIGGSYHLIKEARLSHQGREVLYLVGHAAFDNTCCGVGGCAYAIVAGYVLEWKPQANPEGLPVSEVEPVDQPGDQSAIRRQLLEREPISQVVFM